MGISEAIFYPCIHPVLHCHDHKPKQIKSAQYLCILYGMLYAPFSAVTEVSIRGITSLDKASTWRHLQLACKTVLTMSSDMGFLLSCSVFHRDLSLS